MIEVILSQLKRDREVNFKRYRSSEIDHYLHFCCGLDHAISVIEKLRQETKEKDLPMCEIDKSVCENKVDL